MRSYRTLGGCIIGFITEYFTSSYRLSRVWPNPLRQGAATNIIYGLALGYKSAILPVLIISVIIYVGFSSAGMYSVSLSALGMLSTLATACPRCVRAVCDNAGGVAEMCELPERVRNLTPLTQPATPPQPSAKDLPSDRPPCVACPVWRFHHPRVHFLQVRAWV